MPSAVKLRDGYSAEELRALAKRSKDANQSRRLLSLAAVRDGMERGEAAKIGGLDRQTLRDWVHRFNASGPDGLIDNRNASGPTTRLPPEQLRAFAKLVEAGPDREVDGVVRWRRVDLKLVIAERFGGDYRTTRPAGPCRRTACRRGRNNKSRRGQFRSCLSPGSEPWCHRRAGAQPTELAFDQRVQGPQGGGAGADQVSERR